jgi:hypothetical protein
MNASDWRLLRLKDDYYYEDAETNGPDDERMSIFGFSERPKPIVGRRPTGIDKTGNLASIRDSKRSHSDGPNKRQHNTRSHFT